MFSHYDPDTITLATLDEIPEELVPLQKALKQFLSNNIDNWSTYSLANFLGMDVHTLKAFVGRIPKPSTKVHTIVVLQPIERAEIDSAKLQAGII